MSFSIFNNLRFYKCEEAALTPSMSAMEAEETEEGGSPQFLKKLSSNPTMLENEGLDLCPSFNSYSVNGLAETAARVAMDFEGMVGDGDGGEDDDFEFVSFQKAEEQMIFDCPISPVFPIFNHHLLEMSDGTEANELNHGNAPIVKFSLQKLMSDDREHERELDGDLACSSSTSEADELDMIPPGTYCVWTPRSMEAAERGKCQKSNSTRSGSGSSSSRRWWLQNLLRRSNSEGGKNRLVFLTPSAKSESTTKKEEKTVKLGEDANRKKSCPEANTVAGKSKVKRGVVEKTSSAHELFYVRNRMLKEGDKRRSYLPYRQDLVGFWANVHSVSKALPPL
ncbi:uncharacterized protein LOC111462022 [Cucurbita moschata]|uniref:Uncharacterized protein LOC111462022 n=1 Tax=Cucurbita moschata TaxID=3662 RepID=A0A6J1HAD5_CUCMO|nr:uncharacterized protein LOC111462022 [Cucurbita moschata]